MHPTDDEKNWDTKNPILLKGEKINVISSDGNIRTKTGDGETKYKDLKFDDEYLIQKIETLQEMVNSLSALVGTINEYVGELQKGEVLLVQPMLTAKIQENEGDE